MMHIFGMPAQMAFLWRKKNNIYQTAYDMITTILLLSAGLLCFGLFFKTVDLFEKI